MTVKKQIAKKARVIRSTIKGLTLPQSVKLAKAYLNGNRVAVGNLLDSYGYACQYAITTDDNGIMCGTVTISKGTFSVTVPYTDGIVL